jgi:phosphotriesterase-related protein
MSIITVQGPITESKLGVTLSHEHLLCDLWKVVKNYSAILDDEELAVAELLHYKSLGGNSVVDATSVGLGRNPLALQRIAKACGLNVIMGSGWYRECTYPPYVLEMDANSLADIIVKDITVGADGTGVRAGMVGEIGTERYHISPAQERVFRASARAAQEFQSGRIQPTSANWRWIRSLCSVKRAYPRTESSSAIWVTSTTARWSRRSPVRVSILASTI